MAVIRKVSHPAAALPAAPEGGVETNVAAAPAASTTSYVRLINGCSTYVTPDREVFYAKDESGKQRIYAIKASDLSRVLSYRDDYGRRFFKQMNTPEGEAATPGNINKKPAPSQVFNRNDANADDPEGPGSGDGSRNDEDDDLIDTGAMTLRDRDGKDVGVAV